MGGTDLCTAGVWLAECQAAVLHCKGTTGSLYKLKQSRKLEAAVSSSILAGDSCQSVLHAKSGTPGHLFCFSQALRCLQSAARGSWLLQGAMQMVRPG